MKKVIFFVIFIVVVVGLVLVIDQNLFMKEKSTTEEFIRESIAAGAFYPDLESELNSMIEEFFEKAELPELDKYIRAMVVPHASYVYSGQVAAYGYKAIGLSASSRPIRTVVLIGNSHQDYFDGVSVYEKGYYKTPLGRVEINTDLAKKIIDSHEKISYRESAHTEEHSLEVQLPFLQTILSNQDWKIVPIILGNQPGAVDILVNVLKNLIDDSTLLIASSDLSHYPNYEDAQYSDNKVIQAILTGDSENLRNTVSQLEKENISNLQTCACGQESIEVIMDLMKDKNIKLLKYANSGDVSIGDPPAGEASKSQVVGYATIIFMSDNPSSASGLGKAEQKRLLEIARESLETYVKEGKIKKFEESNPILNKSMGAFVTLKENGQLRGCIGVFSSQDSKEPLYQNVADMAIAAGTKDTRFTPVAKDELDDLEYEISVLSPFKKIDSWKDIEIGKHGVRIKKGAHSGVFLPQVATENNWDLDTFMNTLCSQKAGLPADCWKNSETEIYVFTAHVFGEN